MSISNQFSRNLFKSMVQFSSIVCKSSLRALPVEAIDLHNFDYTYLAYKYSMHCVDQVCLSYDDWFFLPYLAMKKKVGEELE